MHAEIISIGTELTTGAKLDTNSQWLSLELQAAGIPVHYHVTVADDLEANVNVFQAAVGRSDVVLITGGLGPTLDDLTRDVLARFGTNLVPHNRRWRSSAECSPFSAPCPRQRAGHVSGKRADSNRRGRGITEITRPGVGPCRLAARPGSPAK
jgi:nicotinamide-nucleotide amidase